MRNVLKLFCCAEIPHEVFLLAKVELAFKLRMEQLLLAQ